MIPESMYVDIEREMMPMIRRKAARLRGFMDLDDAIQEARLVLLTALHSYDYNRQPDLARYVGVCLNNAFAGQYNKATSQRRMPHRPSLQVNGSYKLVPAPPSSMDFESADDRGNPEFGCLTHESQDVMVDVVKAVEARLPERERNVMLCFAQPPHEITVGSRDPGFNLQVAKYLGLNKNMLDWSIHRIRQTMLDVMRQLEFKDHTGEAVSGLGWPHLAHSGRWHDTTLLEQTIQTRKLDMNVRSEDKRQSSGAEFWTITYDWGEAMFLRLGEMAATLVMEGRFNRISGTLFGFEHGSQPIPVSWYQRCMKAVNGA